MQPLQLRHFRALDGGERPPPVDAPNSDDFLALYPTGARVEMLYDEKGHLLWYPGIIVRSRAALSRDRKPDLAFSIRFDGEDKTYGTFKLSCNSLRLLEDAPTDVENTAAAPQPATVRRSERLNP